MKRLSIFIALVAAMLVSSCGYDDTGLNDRINDIANRLDRLEGTTLPTIDEQVKSINTSITDLKGVDDELRQLINVLKADTEVNATLITALKDKDAELEDKMTTLENYVDNQISDIENWADATFATLGQYAEMQGEISSIKALIEQNRADITEAYTEAIESAITASETSMKAWVNEQLAGYYTTAEIDAKLELLQQSIDSTNESLADEIETLAGRVDAMKTELTDAYQKAITEAIETNNGTINSKIADEIATVNSRIDSEVDAINKRIDALEDRIEAMEDIINKIQALDIIFDNTEGLVCFPGASVEVGYTIVGGDDNTAIESFGDGGWSATVIKESDTAGKIRVTAPEGATSGKVIVLATSGVGGNVMKSLHFDEGVLADIKDSYEVDWEASTLQVALRTNLDYTVNIPADAQSWISVADTRTELRTQTLTFTIAENPEDEPERSATIELINVFGEVLQSFDIVQKLQPASDPIQFADQYAKKVCVEKFDTNGDGELSYKEAAAVTGLSGMFFGDYALAVTSFDEFQYFVNVKNWSNAFSGCSNLKTITIPDSVTTIGGWAFRNCTSLTSVTIPDRVTTIGEHAFNSCYSLTSVTIPDSVTTIEYGAFYNCESLTSVTIPDSVTTIGSSAFAHCYSLTSVTIPDSVTTIGSSAFAYCYSLTSVTIPDSVTTIRGGAFYSCDSLTSVTIPDSVITIGEAALYVCDSLKEVYCESLTPPAMGAKVFDNNNADRVFYVPAESVEAYKTAPQWCNYADVIIGYEF